jgi:hypothetical protein
MKVSTIIIMLLLGMPWPCFPYSPFRDGAMADIKLKVTDEAGSVVSNALVDLIFYVTPEKVKTKKGLTDSTGCFSACEFTIGEVQAWIYRDGYYNTKIFPNVRISPIEEVESSRQWSTESINITAILKKCHNPASLILKGGTFEELNYPATNVVLGLDLKKYEWCPPYGNGQYDDLQLRYNFWRSPTNWLYVYSSLTITMTNCLDGIYLAPTEDSSKLNRCYRANTNEAYIKRLDFVYDRRTGEVVANQEMPRDKYMVFRTRTKVDDEGRLTSANYGLIFEKSEYGLRLKMRTAFNPKVNDTNLECAGGW